MSTSFQEIAASLVREFLSRKGLKQTLAKMDEELPRTHESISNRAALAKSLNIEKWMKRNKEKGSPLQTIIEVIVKYLTDKAGITQSSTTKTSHYPSTPSTGQHNSGEIPSVGVGSDSQKPQMAAEKARLAVGSTNHRSSQLIQPHLGEPSQKPVSGTSLSVSAARGLERRQQECGFKPRSIREWESDQQRAPEIQTEAKPTRHRERANNDQQQPTGTLQPKPKAEPKAEPKSSSLGDLLCEDLEDLDLGTGEHGMEYSGSRCTTTAPGNPQQRMRTVGIPISLDTARRLRELIFGSASARSFNSEWRRQDFTFSQLPGLEYGLVQHKGGPCGVLACVQAYILRHLLFSEPIADDTTGSMSLEQGNEALVSSLTDILWRLGQQSGQAVVALPPSFQSSSTQLPSRSYTPDHITEQAVLYRFSDRPTLKDFIASHVFTFQDESKSGCVHFILSAVLSKGIDSVRSEMDEGGGPLIAAHQYCSQELVNLLLMGYAVSNVFDGDITLESGTTHKSVLKGIAHRSQIGFLSLFEHYGNCIVGSNYKEPVFPIWIVCSESHFTVLFSHKRHLLANPQLQHKFDLFYYDGLANQDEEIRLTIDTSICKANDEVKVQTNLEPPLQLCIQTKWRNATVDWNGTEPLL